jgi:hypothetical protein
MYNIPYRVSCVAFPLRNTVLSNTSQASGTTSGWGNLGRWQTSTGIPSTDQQVPLYTVITLTFGYLYSFTARIESEVLWNAYTF